MSYYDYKWGEKRHISHNNVLFRAKWSRGVSLFPFERSVFTLRINECVEFVIFLKLEFFVTFILNSKIFFEVYGTTQP